MSIPGRQSINIGLPNEPTNSDTIRDAFIKVENNFVNLFENANQDPQFPIATEEEAQEGTSNEVLMTPLRTFEAFGNLVDSTIQQVEELGDEKVNLARQWAEGTEPGGEGTSSSREWAALAAQRAIEATQNGQQQVELARQWAEGTEPGGEGTLSSREWALQSEALGAAQVFLAEAAALQSEILGAEQVALAESAANQASIFRNQSETFSLISQASANFKGIWSSSTNYLLGDCVTLGDQFYLALKNNTNENPATTPTSWVNTILEDFTELPDYDFSIATTDFIPVSQNGMMKKISPAQLRTTEVYSSGTWFGTDLPSNTSIGPTPNRMMLFPFTAKAPVELERFQILSGDIPVSSPASIAMAIYDSNEYGLPTGDPIFAGDAFIPSYPQRQVGYNSLINLPGRRVWLAFVASSGGNNVQLRSVTTSGNPTYQRELFSVIGSSGNSILSDASNIAPFIDGVTPGIWPTLTGNFSDFSGRTTPNNYPTFSFRSKENGSILSLLFSNNEQGYLLDPSDLSTMFQDVQGTIPVTGIGQPVGRIEDKSGRRNHFIQQTPESRPLLQMDENGRYYLDFDGVNDWMRTQVGSDINPGTDKVQVCAGFRKLVDTSPSVITSSSLVTGNGRWDLYSTLTANVATAAFSALGTGVRTVDGILAAPTTAVLYASADIAMPLVRIDINQNNPVTNGSTLGTGNFVTNPHFIGQRGSNTMRLQGRIYSVVCRYGPNLTEFQIAKLKEYVSTKTGAF